MAGAIKAVLFCHCWERKWLQYKLFLLPCFQDKTACWILSNWLFCGREIKLKLSSQNFCWAIGVTLERLKIGVWTQLRAQRKSSPDHFNHFTPSPASLWGCMSDGECETPELRSRAITLWPVWVSTSRTHRLWDTEESRYWRRPARLRTLSLGVIFSPAFELNPFSRGFGLQGLTVVWPMCLNQEICI